MTEQEKKELKEAIKELKESIRIIGEQEFVFELDGAWQKYVKVQLNLIPDKTYYIVNEKYQGWQFRSVPTDKKVADAVQKAMDEDSSLRGHYKIKVIK